MTKPTSTEVTEYAQSIDYVLDGDAFVDYYQSQGWKKANGRPLMDWQCAVRTWKRKEHAKQTRKTKLFPIAGKTCSRQGCNLPAVYKNTGGQYDSYACSDHLPDKVKARYE